MQYKRSPPTKTRIIPCLHHSANINQTVAVIHLTIKNAATLECHATDTERDHIPCNSKNTQERPVLLSIEVEHHTLIQTTHMNALGLINLDINFVHLLYTKQTLIYNAFIEAYSEKHGRKLAVPSEL